jgi:hypothetical protein
MNIVEDSQNSQNDQNDVQQEKQRLLLPVLERHPALTRLQGNPMLISALAYELHEKPMDELD